MDSQLAKMFNDVQVVRRDKKPVASELLWLFFDVRFQKGSDCRIWLGYISCRSNMVVTNDVKLPTCNELTVTEVDLTTATLMTAAPHLGKACEAVNNEFMLCRYELNDPRACINLGKKVTACTLSFFKSLKKSCLNEFNQYADCVDKSSGNYSYKPCRSTQAVFDGCMKDKLDMERPDFGYFTRARIHCSPRPAPELPPCPCTKKFPDATPSLPDSKPRPPARFSSRFYWMTE